MAQVSDPLDPTDGAARREGFLLAAFCALFVVGVWTVVASEFGAQEPAPRTGPSVSPSTESQAPPSK